MRARDVFVIDGSLLTSSRTTNGSSLSPPQGRWMAEKLTKKENQWRKKYRWLLFGLKYAICFPYTESKYGKFEIRIISWVFAYWYIVYGFMFGVAAEHICFLTKTILGGKLTTFQFTVCAYNAVSMVYVMCFPLTLISGYRQMAEFINSWPEFEEKTEKFLGERVNLTRLKVFYLVPVFTVPGSIIVSAAFVNFKFWNFWVVSLIASYAVSLILMYWTATTLELCDISGAINRKIYESLCERETKTSLNQIIEMKSVWRDLWKMVELHNGAWSHMLLFTSLTLCCIFIMSGFANLVYLVVKNDFIYGALFSFFISGVVSYWLFESGHILTTRAAQELLKTLAQAHSESLDGMAAAEVQSFMKMVYMKNPKITFGGFLTADRSAMTSMLSVTVTYLIVLIQMQTETEETNDADEGLNIQESTWIS